MIDEGGNPSLSVESTVNIMLVDDEPPIISGTRNSQVFIEEGGAIHLVEPTVIIMDADNCKNHTLIERVEVQLVNPVEGEDQLIVDEETLSTFFANYTCNMLYDSMSCYEEWLQTLQYNNTNKEPRSFRTERRVRIEVRMLKSVCRLKVRTLLYNDLIGILNSLSIYNFV